MKNILYLCKSDSQSDSYILLSEIIIRSLQKGGYSISIKGDKIFSRHYSEKYLYKDDETLHMKWDIMIIQNSECLIEYATFIRSLGSIPILFVSHTTSIRGHITSLKNLFGIISLNSINYLRPYGVPDQLHYRIKLPTPTNRKISLGISQGDKPHILYYPVINNTDDLLKLSSICEQFNVEITVISNYNSILTPIHRSKLLNISSRKSLASLFKKSQIVIASELDAIRAISENQVCIIMDEKNYVGRVTEKNYNIIAGHNFKCTSKPTYECYTSELTLGLSPLDILKIEIQNVLETGVNESEVTLLKNIVTKDFTSIETNQKIQILVEEVLELSSKLRNNIQMKQLKPYLTNCFNIRNINRRLFIFKDKNCFCEIDSKSLDLINQCDGNKSMQDIALSNTLNKQELKTFIDNIKYLWEDKLVMFNYNLVC